MVHTKKGKAYLLIAAVSALFSYLITALFYFPHFGISLSLIILTVLLYKFKSNKVKETHYYFFLTLLLAIFISIRSEPLITFFNVLSTLLFGSLMTLSSNKESEMNIFRVALSPFYLLTKSFFTKSDYYPETSVNKNEGKPKINVAEIIGGVLITIILLIVIIPLLASTNPFFMKLIDNISKLEWLNYLFKNLDYQDAFIWCLRFVFFFIFIFIVPKMATFTKIDGSFRLKLPIQSVNLPLLIPKIGTVLVLTVYFITQFELYFASKETLSQMGLTYSEYTREVFAQLLVVSGIVIALIYNDLRKEKLHRLLTYILTVQGIFLTFMAFKSVFEYSSTWGFTYLRLYGFTGVVLALGVFVLFLSNYLKKLSNSNFIKRTVIFTGIVLVIVNILNFDYLIYNFRKSITGQGIDYVYLTSLSADSLSYDEQYKRLIKKVTEDPSNLNTIDYSISGRLVYKIESLQNKYKEFDLRTFNLLDYLQYQQIKSINLQEYYALAQHALPAF